MTGRARTNNLWPPEPTSEQRGNRRCHDSLEVWVLEDLWRDVERIVVLGGVERLPHALDQGYAYGLLWLAGAIILLGGVALLIGYSSREVAHAQKVKKAIDSEEL